MALYSVWDNQCGQFMNTGSNSSTQENAINDIFNFWRTDLEIENDNEEKELDNYTKEQKIDIIHADGYLITKHEIPINISY